MDNIYKIPLALHAQKLDQIVAERFGLTDLPDADLSDWHHVINTMEFPEAEVTIAMVGKYVDLTESYKSLNEALTHGGIHTSTRVNIVYVDSEKLESEEDGLEMKALMAADAILVVQVRAECLVMG